MVINIGLVFVYVFIDCRVMPRVGFRYCFDNDLFGFWLLLV